MVNVVVLQDVPESDYGYINFYEEDQETYKEGHPCYIRSGIGFVKPFLKPKGKTIENIPGYHIADNGIPVLFHGFGYDFLNCDLLNGNDYNGTLEQFEENHQIEWIK